MPLGGEILQVLVIRKHPDWLCGADEVRMPLFEGSHDRQELLIVDLIIALGWGVLFREECHGTEDAIVIRLRQHSCGDVVGCIHFDDDCFLLVQMLKYGGRSESVL